MPENNLSTALNKRKDIRYKGIYFTQFAEHGKETEIHQKKYRGKTLPFGNSKKRIKPNKREKKRKKIKRAKIRRKSRQTREKIIIVLGKTGKKST